MKKKILAIGLAAAMSVTAVGLMAGCGGDNGGDTLTLSGSTSVQPLMQELAAKYEELNEGVKVEVSGGGSGVGISDAQEGKVDIGMSSRDLHSDETGVTSKKIADDGIAVIVSAGNTVTEVTSAEVFDLYMSGTAIDGTITKAVMREAASGTRDAFLELIKKDGTSMKDAYAEKLAFAGCVQEANSTDLAITTVSQDNATLGFISLGSVAANASKIKALAVDGVEATTANVSNSTYKLVRPFNLIYQEDELSDLAKDFLAFIDSKEGQAIINEDYIGQVSNAADYTPYVK